MKTRLEIVASGFGGQGVVRLGQILGEAAVKKNLRVTMLKSHGTEMRGGYVRSQVVFSNKAIDSPMCENPNFFIALSSAAYNRFKDTVPKEGTILYDPGFVEDVDEQLPCIQRPLPAKKLALGELGRPIYANSIALGAVASLLKDTLDKEQVTTSMLEIIPKFHDENIRAFEIGYSLYG